MIAMINMPFASLMHPCLPVGLIKARLQAAGLHCRVFNFNFLFAQRIGISAYQLLALQKGQDPLVAEWLFARQAWPEGLTLGDDEFLKLAGQTPFISLGKTGAADRLYTIRETIVPQFLGEAAQRLLSCSTVAAIGFSCGFFQSLASLALVRRIKAGRPEIKIACGGSGFHGIMGRELMAKCDFIDAVALGEADDVVVPLFEALSRGRDPEGLQGVLYRDRQGRVCEGPGYRPVPAEVLEDNPPPDFDEHFADSQRLGLLDDPQARPKLFTALETSRGCWKAQKMLCTFCGLNNREIRFRRMSTQRVMACLDHLAGRYPLRRFQLADRILPKAFFQDLFPWLGEKPLGDNVEFWAESRTTLSRRQVALMAAAGVIYVQAGIESLSTNMLKCVRKAVTAIKNVHFLKLCRTYGIYALWNLLIRVPGEKQRDYDQMAALIPKIVHFTPPFWGTRMVEMQRFSRYFNEPGRWADHIRPWPYYRGLYPENRIDIGKVAYFFDADWKDVLDDRQAYRELIRKTDGWIDTWRFSSKLPALTFENLPDGRMSLVDTRQPGRVYTYTLEPGEADVYRTIDDPGAVQKLMRLPIGRMMSKRQVREILSSFVAEGLAISEGGRYLGLALPEGTPEPDPSFRRSQTGMDVRRKDLPAAGHGKTAEDR